MLFIVFAISEYPVMRPMFGMLIFPILVEWVPLVVDTGGARQGVSELLQAVYTKPLGIRCGFASILKLNFGFPDFGGRMCPYGGRH